jgi:predicted transcriptional regulator
MIVSQIIQTGFPVVHLSDTVPEVLDLMDSYEVFHLPVVEKGVYIGLISKLVLEEASDEQLVNSLSHFFTPEYCNDQVFFFDALQLIVAHSLSLLPVIQSDTFVGVITAKEMLRVVAGFLNTQDKCGVIVIESDPLRFSLGEVNRLIESNDLSILHFSSRRESGLLIATLRVSKMEIATAVATLQQHGYVVRYYFGNGEEDHEVHENYQHLLAYLNI